MTDPDPEVVALVSAAVDALWPTGALPVGGDGSSHRSWRFSGRWWHRPTPMGRARP